MRESKFRAWDTENKCWLIWTMPDKQEAVDLLANEMFFSCGDQKTRGQYTGLRDSKGKEIYEGDIIKHLKYGGIYPVVYSCENTGYDLKTRHSQMHLCIDCCPNLEVIGNIYENQGLLEAKQ